MCIRDRFRTFLEVEQPESEFLLRVDPDEGIGFFEADGGIWKLEAPKIELIGRKFITSMP